MTSCGIQVSGRFGLPFVHAVGCCVISLHFHISLVEYVKTGKRLSCAEHTVQVTFCCACRQWPQPPSSLTAKMRTMMFLRWQSSFPAAAAAAGKGLQDHRQQGQASVALLVTGLPQLQMSPSQGQSMWLLLTVCVNCEAYNCTVTIEHMHIHARRRHPLHLCSGWT